ncbi:MAG: RNase III inhibitor [Balneolaceae bacterium]|nr:MAG: RNase III inhibitor [Balneolaceae bacterium]
MTITLIDNINIEVVNGDITRQPDCDAIVNAANAQLKSGGGVAGAVHRIGDPDLEERTRKFAPIKTGEAVITSAPNFPNKYIIHCLGPVYGKDKPEDQFLKSCYTNALKLADDNELQSIAFPAISTGIFGYPVEDAAKVAAEVFKAVAPGLTCITIIRMVLWSKEDCTIHNEVFKSILS